MRPWGNAVALALCSIALAACSGGDDAAAPTTIVVTTDAPDTTPATTIAPTTSPPTQATTTTTDPAATLAAEVEAALLETFRLTDEAFQDPTDQAKVDAALAGYTGDALELVTAQFEEFQQSNLATRPNPDVEANTSIETPAVPNGIQADAFVVQVCEVNSWIVVEPGAGANGSDAIVDPDIVSSRSLFLLQLEGAKWRVSAGERLGEWPGEVECPSEF